ncbi:MAG: hypothetical protein IPL10_01680 [Bacteroidetes bacterium]|jgi:hypothetical protein|nr:hypothetical protein [Bacteroidota bacterium]
MIRSLFFTLILIIFAISSKAQNKDTILLMNGNVVVEKVLDTLIGAVTIVNPANVAEKLHYEYDDIYCVKYAVGFTDYYYSQDTLKGNYFTRDEMLYYIYGERDARKGFKAPGALIGAGVVGLVSGGLGLFFAPIFPYGYMALTGVPKVRIRHKTISNPNYIEQDAYILGYERVSRSRRRIKALIGGTIGLAAGYGLYFGILKDKLPASLTLRF